MKDKQPYVSEDVNMTIWTQMLKRLNLSILALLLILFFVGFGTSKSSASIPKNNNNIAELTAATPYINADNILDDPDQKISDTFKIPPLLKRRTKFWFNIYAKYGSYDHIIHHTDYPWIVYKVLNTRKFFNGKGAYWYKNKKAKDFVIAQKKLVKKRLKYLSNRKHYRNLKGLDAKLYSTLKNLRGSRRSVFKTASQQLRSQLGQRDFIIKGLQTAPKYLTFMEEEFKKRGVPIELTRMPFVESSFNTNAYSKVGASGIWQIMRYSARPYLKVAGDIDERNNPIKASKAAARHLKRDFRILKSWPLAVAAYNHGVGSMKKASKKLDTKNFVTIISRYQAKSFGFASKNFYPSFLAMLHAHTYKKQIYPAVNEPKPLEFEEYRLTKKIRPLQLSALSGVPITELKNLNLDIRTILKRNQYIPAKHVLIFPLGHKDVFASNYKKYLNGLRQSKNAVSENINAVKN